MDLVALKRFTHTAPGCRLARRVGEGVVHIHESTYVLARAEAGKGGEREGVELKLRSNGTYHCRFFHVV